MMDNWRVAIDALVFEKGEKRNGYYCATLTSTEILQRAEAVITDHNHQNVKRVAELQYPKTKIESVGINGAGGWILHFKIRSK